MMMMTHPVIFWGFVTTTIAITTTYKCDWKTWLLDVPLLVVVVVQTLALTIVETCQLLFSTVYLIIIQYYYYCKITMCSLTTQASSMMQINDTHQQILLLQLCLVKYGEPCFLIWPSMQSCKALILNDQSKLLLLLLAKQFFEKVMILHNSSSRLSTKTGLINFFFVHLMYYC